MTEWLFRALAVIAFFFGVGVLFFAIQSYPSSEIVIEWSTASEFDIAGFNILRSEQENGTFTQINETIIPPAGDSLTGGEYSYEDQQVSGGQTYYYQLQEVELSGTTTLHGPIEAKATHGGLVEAALSVLLISGSILTLILSARVKPKA